MRYCPTFCKYDYGLCFFWGVWFCLSDHIRCETQKPHHKVLVCCPTGKQQSAIIIVAYIMKYGQVNLPIATKFITSKCKGVFQPEMIFKNSLEMYQKYLIQ